MKFVLAAGGTAGHINPALALAEELCDRGHEVMMLGNPLGLEARLVQEASLPFIGIASSGFDRAHLSSAVGFIRRVQKGKQILKRRFKEEQVDALVGFGAYVEVAATLAARKLKIPYMLHEQNSVPGLANRYCSRHAHLVALSYPEAKPYFAWRGKMPKTRFITTGNPVRRSLLMHEPLLAREALGIKEDERLLLIFGGSLGARHLNESLIAALEIILAQEDLKVIHASGAQDYENACMLFNAEFDRLLSQGKLKESDRQRWQIHEYINDMGAYMRAADLVISRAGASSLAEISALALPALLVPYPYARANHQFKNAQHLLKSGAAQLIADADLDNKELLWSCLKSFLGDKDAAQNMRLKALELSGEGASYKLANAAELVAEGMNGAGI